MGSKKTHYPVTFTLILAVFCLILSCKSGPAPVTPPLENKEPESIQPEPAFDPGEITREYRDATMAEVRIFIEDLNRIIRTQNYTAWRASLSQEYFDEISSRENLEMISEQPAMKTRRVILRTAEDYFKHVVVPSRANSRVDDIEFISSTRVKVFTVMTNRAGEEQRLRLYDLEKSGNTWKIIS